MVKIKANHNVNIIVNTMFNMKALSDIEIKLSP